MAGRIWYTENVIMCAEIGLVQTVSRTRNARPYGVGAPFRYTRRGAESRKAASVQRERSVAPSHAVTLVQIV